MCSLTTAEYWAAMSDRILCLLYSVIYYSCLIDNDTLWFRFMIVPKPMVSFLLFIISIILVYVLSGH